MSSVFNELKEEVLPELRRSQIVNSTDIQGKTDAEIMAAFRNGQELTVEEYLYAAETLANGTEEQVAILTAASKKYNAPAFTTTWVSHRPRQATRLLRSNRSRRLPRWIRRAKSPRTSSWATWPTATPPRLRSMPSCRCTGQGRYRCCRRRLQGCCPEPRRYNEAVAQVMSNNLSAAQAGYLQGQLGRRRLPACSYRC